MLRKVLSSKGFWALALTVIMAGAAYAGADCAKGHKVSTAGKGAHCHLMAKQIAKNGEMTDDGAVVTLTGKTEAAIGHIKSHLEAHVDGDSCPDCPLSRDDVKTTIELSEKGGTITAVGSTEEAVDILHEWAKKPAGQCCNPNAKADKA